MTVGRLMKHEGTIYIRSHYGACWLLRWWGIRGHGGGHIQNCYMYYELRVPGHTVPYILNAFAMSIDQLEMIWPRDPSFSNCISFIIAL